MMEALVIGATGYVGRHVAAALAARGCRVSGNARSEANATALAAAGVGVVPGSFEDMPALCAAAARFELVVMAAMVPFESEVAITAALLDACRAGATRHFLFTSGTGVLSIEAKDGAWSQYSFAEDDPFPFPARHNRTVRIETENAVRAAAGDALATFVIRPPLIFGNAGSIQVPQIFESARATGDACYLGHGLNLYSSVHVEDLAEVFCLALEKGVPGALYHTVSGETNFRSIAEAVARVTGGGTRSLDYPAACELWGQVWVDLALAVNSRSVARRTVDELGWQPRFPDLIEDIRSGSYRAHYEQAGFSEYRWASHG